MRWAAAGMMLLHHAAFAREYAVSGTGWVIVDADGASPRLVRLIEDTARQLPEEYRALNVKIRLADAPRLVERGPHVLGRAARFGSSVTLNVLGLSERLADLRTESGATFLAGASMQRGAEYLTRRVLVHELTHVLDRRLRLSRSRSWKDLSGWSWLSRFPTPWPRAASGDFAAPWGARSPAEDLATFAEVFYFPPRVDALGAEAHPRCLFPRKFEWMVARFGAPVSYQTDRVLCSGPADIGLSPDRVSEVDILWASPTLSSAASVGGHLLVSIQPSKTAESSAGGATTYALVADTRGSVSNAFQFIAFGIAGGYPGRVVRQADAMTRWRYVGGEQRDLLRYRWVLESDEEAELFERLNDMLLHWHRPYLFFHQNCSALIVELSNVIEENGVSVPIVVPPDLVLMQLAKKSRIEPLPVLPDRDLAPATRLRLVDAALPGMWTEVCGRRWPGLRSPRAYVRNRAYIELTQLALNVDEPWCWREFSRAIYLGTLLERSLSGGFAKGGRGDGSDQPHDETHRRNPALTQAIATMRKHLPLEERVRVKHTIDSIVADQWEETESANARRRFTPYVPLDVGIGYSGDIAEAYFSRAAIDLDRGEPRTFHPARQVDLRVLAFTTHVPVRGGIRGELSLTSFRYYPEPLTHRLPLGFGADIIDLDYRRNWQTDQQLWIEWGRAVAGLNIYSGGMGTRRLDIEAGVAYRTSRVGAERTSLLGHPLVLHPVVHGNAPIIWDFDATVSFAPVIDYTRGLADYLLAGEFHTRWFQWRIGKRRIVRLAIDAEYERAFKGSLAVRPARIGIGLRIHPW